MAKTFKDSKAARELRQDRLRRERKQMKQRGRNTEDSLFKRLWNMELLAS